MKRKSLFHSLIYGNKAVEMCIFFTVATMLDLLMCVSQGVMEISYWHLGMRFILCVCITLSFYVFMLFEKLPIYVMLIIHCGMSILIMVGWVWATSLFSEVHPNAYRDAVRTILMIYPVIILGCITLEGLKTAKANKILKERLEEADKD